MKRFFTVTYFACFQSITSKYDRLQSFWFWRTLSFIQWVNIKKKGIEKRTGESVVTTNCNKL